MKASSVLAFVKQSRWQRETLLFATSDILVRNMRSTINVKRFSLHSFQKICAIGKLVYTRLVDSIQQVHVSITAQLEISALLVQIAYQKTEGNPAIK